MRRDLYEQPGFFTRCAFVYEIFLESVSFLLFLISTFNLFEDSQHLVMLFWPSLIYLLINLAIILLLLRRMTVIGALLMLITPLFTIFYISFIIASSGGPEYNEPWGLVILSIWILIPFLLGLLLLVDESGKSIRSSKSK